jgi:Flp pilus assembly protein TadG
VRHRRERGQGLVEIALVLPLFLLAIFALVDFGHAVFAYSTLSNSTAQGARAAIVRNGPASCTGLTKTGCAERVTRDFAGVGFNSPVTATATCVPADRCIIGAQLTVTASGTIILVTPLVAQFVGPIHIQAASSMTVEAAAP